ncbi:MAG: GCN5-related N-acetyltransferase [Verrucomicrobia bacterium]|nr:GCN5-related N-acetyltransferase [Verrucomicrobiota bacterium]
MRSWQPALTITPAEIARHPTYHLRQDGRILGFFLLQLEGDQARLEHCWILPEAMGLGFGRALFARAEGVARESGANKISIVSDPHAEGFYLRMGARSCGQEPSSVDGVPRFLPRLEKLL